MQRGGSCRAPWASQGSRFGLPVPCETSPRPPGGWGAQRGPKPSHAGPSTLVPCPTGCWWPSLSAQWPRPHGCHSRAGAGTEHFVRVGPTPGPCRRGAQGRLVPNSFPALLQDPLLPQTPAGAAPRAAWLSAGTRVVYCLPPPDRLLGGHSNKRGPRTPNSAPKRYETDPQSHGGTAAWAEQRDRPHGTDPTGQTHSCPLRRHRHIPPTPPASVSLWFPPRPGGRAPTPLRQPHCAPAPRGCWRPQDHPVQPPQNPLSRQSPPPTGAPHTLLSTPLAKKPHKHPKEPRKHLGGPQTPTPREPHKQQHGPTAQRCSRPACPTPGGQRARLLPPRPAAPRTPNAPRAPRGSAESRPPAWHRDGGHGHGARRLPWVWD